MLYIPDHLKKAYENGTATSKELAEHLNVHPVTIRKLLRRTSLPKLASKAELTRIRDIFRASKAHLPAKELAPLLNVSYATALRIRIKYGTNDTKSK